MQFRLGHILVAISILAVFCGLVFAAPPIVGTPLLCFFLVVCPAIWFAGAIYARGARQAFFIGGIAGGAVPYTICTYFAASQYLSLYFAIMPVYAGQGDTDDTIWLPAIQTSAWMMNLATLIPGPFSFAGGGLSVLVYRVFSPKQQDAK